MHVTYMFCSLGRTDLLSINAQRQTAKTDAYGRLTGLRRVNREQKSIASAKGLRNDNLHSPRIIQASPPEFIIHPSLSALVGSFLLL